MNARRFLSLTTTVAASIGDVRVIDGQRHEPGRYHFFLKNNLKHNCIMWNDYYVTVTPCRTPRTFPRGEVFGYDGITWQYYERYGLPVMHTETNLAQGPNGDESVDWLWKQWANVLRVRNDGIPIVGFTWYSLTDQIDWDSALREVRGNVNPVGLYDLNRNIRPVGEAYKQLIQDWADVLPTQSVCLRVPVVPPSEHDQAWARNVRSESRLRRKAERTAQSISDLVGWRL
ncbi:MAG: hypothetical protein WKF37_08930 [Bryobacteraceae bacterium]